jgi:hypothetical protein
VRTPTWDLPGLIADANLRVVSDDDIDRPAYHSEPDRPHDRTTPPAPMNDATLVSKRVDWGEQTLAKVFPSASLPYRYSVDRRLADRFDVEDIVEAMSRWDGVEGSRWATQFVGLVDVDRHGRSGDSSIIYLRDRCPGQWLGYARWHLSPEQGAVDARYGAAAVYSSRVDIGICPSVTDASRLKATLVHEVGHAMGMDHLCDVGDHCGGHRAKTPRHSGTGPCRPMHAVVRPCGELTDPDRNAVIHLHPTLPRLAGATAVETAARASYATTRTGSAPVVVLVREGAPPHEEVLAAALAGFVNAPLLIASPDPEACLVGPGATELGRVAKRSGHVLLVGAWPAACDEALARWQLDIERLSAGHHIALSVAIAHRVAESGRMGDAVFLASVHPDDRGRLPGALVAAAAGGPLLFTRSGRLPAEVADWLERHPQLRRVYLMGTRDEVDEAVADEVRALDLEVVRLGGPDAVRATAVGASTIDLFPPGGPVVLASVDSWTDGAVAASVAARLGAPLLLTPDEPAPTVERWLADRQPSGGYLVGGHTAVPHPVHWRYATGVAPAPDPMPRGRGDGPIMLLHSAIQSFFPKLDR